MGMQNFQPAFFFEVLNDLQRVVLVRQRGNLMPDSAAQNVVDVLTFLGGIIAGLRALLDLPMEPGRKTRGADQPRGIFQKRIVVQDANQLGFNISHAVERVE